MRLRHIEVFNAIMLTGSVSGAARLVNVTQPAVSRILQHAESQLGLALFQRTKGRLTPTPEALALYPHIERLFAQLDEVQRLAANLKAGKTAQALRILTVLALSYEVLPRALKRFRATYPDVAVHVQSLHSAQVVSGLVLQEADVGLVLSPISHPALTQEPLADGRLVCVAPKGVLPVRLARAAQLSLPDLAGFPVIALDARDPMGISLAQACREAGVGLRSDISVQTYHAALAFAHHGMGLALVDSFTAMSADRKLVNVLPLDPVLPVPLRALHPAGKPGSVPLRAFVRCVQQAVSDI
ncbi:MAG: LysR substrate-binding domain-containing protein [Ramlibacter sp.]|jgi:DNA-binding transcriptional LysR family regulator